MKRCKINREGNKIRNVLRFFSEGGGRGVVLVLHNAKETDSRHLTFISRALPESAFKHSHHYHWDCNTNRSGERSKKGVVESN